MLVLFREIQSLAIQFSIFHLKVWAFISTIANCGSYISYCHQVYVHIASGQYQEISIPIRFSQPSIAFYFRTRQLCSYISQLLGAILFYLKIDCSRYLDANLCSQLICIAPYLSSIQIFTTLIRRYICLLTLLIQLQTIGCKRCIPILLQLSLCSEDSCSILSSNSFGLDIMTKGIGSSLKIDALS